MTMGNKKYWTIGMSSLGGITPIVSLGQLVTVVDIVLGAAVLGGITFGVCSMFNSNGSSQTKTIVNSPTNRFSKFIKTAVSGVPQANGWYRDPSGLDLWRYLENGQWTIHVSHGQKDTTSMNTPSEISEPASSDNFMNSLHERIESSERSVDSATKPAESVQLAQKLEQIERIAELRQKDMISQQEFENLKSEILGNQ
jgi:hypothetical protein